MRNEKGTAQVGVHHGVPVIPAHLQRGLADVAACVVHQDTNRAAQFYGSSFGCRTEGSDTLLVAHVQRQRPRLDAHAREFRQERIAVPGLAAGED